MARANTALKSENSIAAPSREDFAAMLEQSFETQSPQEGSVIKGTIVSIENDFAMVDVGLKTEGRISLKEFAMPGVPADIKVGDTVEVYLERVENALGEAVLSRDKARREESWIKLEKALLIYLFALQFCPEGLLGCFLGVDVPALSSDAKHYFCIFLLPHRFAIKKRALMNALFRCL